MLIKYKTEILSKEWGKIISNVENFVSSLNMYFKRFVWLPNSISSIETLYFWK